jgi:hypothetical protein
VTAIEDRLRDAFLAEAEQVGDSPDLFERIALSIDDDRRRRRRRRRSLLVALALAGAITALLAAVTDIREGDVLMDWWVLELLTTLALVGLALYLGPLIKRFGKAYAADVFRANPRTGKSFIVLTDIAYYLIFSSYILFTTTFELPSDWDSVVNGAQLKSEVARVAGIALIIGILHGANLLALPVIGRLLTLNRQLDERVGPQRPFPGDGPSTPAARDR